VSTRHSETERTFDLPDQAATLPDLTAATDGVVASVTDAGTDELEATYVDTDALHLIRRRVTLRRRTGGADAGWHLKLPPEGDTRQEVHWPLGDSADLPDEIAGTVTALAPATALRPVVRLATSRRRLLLHDGSGVTLAELSDDQVSSTLLDGSGGQSVTVWREVEVELVEGTAADLDVVESALLAAGAVRAATPSKLARALAGHPRFVAPSAQPALSRSSSAGDVLVAYLREHLDRLRRADLALRLDPDGEGVHDMRVESRRLRTALDAYRELLDEATARHLERELKLLGRVLSQVRDRQVASGLLAERLRGSDRAAAVLALYERELSVDHDRILADMHAWLGAERYTGLLAGLEALTEEGAVQPEAEQPGRTVLTNQLRRALRRLEDDARAARKAAGAERIEALHDLRKTAKRLRYACEVAAPVAGKPAQRMVQRTKELQEVLGNHLDRVALAERLEPLTVLDGATAADGFLLGRLHERLDVEIDAAAGEHRRAVRRVSDGKATRWLR
jgi:CHAD domain-containing protein